MADNKKTTKINDLFPVVKGVIVIPDGYQHDREAGDWLRTNRRRLKREAEKKSTKR